MGFIKSRYFIKLRQVNLVDRQKLQALIQRSIQNDLAKALQQQNKIVIIYGARQVGKTTLVRQLLKGLPYRSLYVNADLQQYQRALSSRNLELMKELIGKNELLFIDEAQNITDIGINLKILHDSLPELKIIATGSSAFELANQTKEPLTGRTRTFKLYPIAVQELSEGNTPLELKAKLEQYMLYGMYPEVLNIQGADEKIAHLRELASAYLYKDVLELSGVQHSDKIYRLLQLLALQIGSEVSIHELAKSLGLSQPTVDRYIDLLEKGFILFRLSGFSRNLRKEITKKKKIFFFDLGVRNVLVENFNPLTARQDVGALWENFLVAERMKKIAYDQLYGRTHFWRTHTGAELDYVEERNGRLHGYEFKWKPKKRRPPKAWLETYPQATYDTVDQDNFLNFVA